MFKSALVALFSLIFIIQFPVQAKTTASSSTDAERSNVKKATKTKAGKRRAAAKTGGSLDRREKLVRKVVTVQGKQKVTYQRVAAKPVLPAVPPVLSAGDLAGLNLTQDPLELKSSVALVIDPVDSKVLFEKNSAVPLPIASLTKLMTSLIVVEARQDMNELLEITEADVDREKNTHSRLRVGMHMTRADLLHIALMSSENRAASALGRNYPGGLPVFVAAMNAKAKELGMSETRYVEPTGLSSHNVASARDLVKLVLAAGQHPLIRQYSTDEKYMVDSGGRTLAYANSNRLVANPDWDIGLQKTGYISEAGRCLVMLTKIDGRSIVMVFLDSKGKFSRLADAGRIRKWLSDLRPQHLSDARHVDGRS